MKTEEQHKFHNVVESVGETFQNHPLDLVNEQTLHPRLVEKLNEKLTTRYIHAYLNTEWKDWKSDWKKKTWTEINNKKSGKASRLRTEVCFKDKIYGGCQSSNKFDIVLFGKQKRLEFLCKPRGPANWFSYENDVEVIAEVKHSKTHSEKHFFKQGEGVADIQELANFKSDERSQDTKIERVFIFANHYPINHANDNACDRSEEWWESLKRNLKDEPLDSPVAVYYIPRKYSTEFDVSIQKKIIEKTDHGIKLKNFD